MQVGKAYATRASRAVNKKDAVALQEEGFERLQAVFSRGSYAGGGWVEQLTQGSALECAARSSLVPAHLATHSPGIPPAVDELKDVAKSLRRLPVVEPEVPTVSGLRAGNSCGSALSTIQPSTHTIPQPSCLAHFPSPPPCPQRQVALVGAPNVGKSSLVQLLSSGLPEVQNYPFTTRSIKMGHFFVLGRRHQITGGRCWRGWWVGWGGAMM